MTITTQRNRISHVGNGIIVDFAFDFLVFEPEHMQVRLDGIIQGAGTYTIAGLNNANGGTVTFNTAPGNGVTVTLTRIVPHTQEVDYDRFDPFPSATHERALDLAAMGRQQLEQGTDDSLVYNAADAATESQRTLPRLADLEGRLLSWSVGSGIPTPVMLSDLDPQATPVSPWGQSLITQADAKAARAYQQAKGLFSGAGPPGPSFDEAQGVGVGDAYIDTDTGRKFYCVRATASQAAWASDSVHQLSWFAPLESVAGSRTSTTVAQFSFAGGYLKHRALGHYKYFQGLSLSVNLTLTGPGGNDGQSLVSGEYHQVFIIGQEDGTVALVLTPSDLMPSFAQLPGYDYYGGVSSLKLVGTTEYGEFVQRADRVGISETTIVSGGVNTTATPVPLAGLLPQSSVARELIGRLVVAAGSANAVGIVQPTASDFIGSQVVQGPRGADSTSAPMSVAYTEPHQIFYKVLAGTTMSVVIDGFRL